MLTYEETIDAIIAANTATEKLELIEDLSELRVGNPNYLRLLPLIAEESNTEVIEALTAETYIFAEELDTTDIQLFSYLNDGYVEPNPGLNDANTYVAYTGVYFSDTGETT